MWYSESSEWTLKYLIESLYRNLTLIQKRWRDGVLRNSVAKPRAEFRFSLTEHDTASSVDDRFNLRELARMSCRHPIVCHSNRADWLGMLENETRLLNSVLWYALTIKKKVLEQTKSRIRYSKNYWKYTIGKENVKADNGDE